MSWARWFFGDLLLPGHRKFTMYQVLLQYICTYFFLYFAAVIFLVSHKKINIKLIEVLYTLLKMHHECDTFLWFCIICNFLRKQYPQWNQGQNGMQFCFNLFIRWCTVSHIVNQKVQKMLANGNLRLTILYFILVYGKDFEIFISYFTYHMPVVVKSLACGHFNWKKKIFIKYIKT